MANELTIVVHNLLIFFLFNFNTYPLIIHFLTKLRLEILVQETYRKSFSTYYSPTQATRFL